MYTLHEPHQERNARFLIPRWFGLVSAAVLWGIVESGCSNGKQGHAASSSWKSAPVLTASLSPEVQLGDFAMQPPAGFSLSQKQMNSRDGKGELCIFTGPQHPNGQSAQIYMMIGNDGGHMSSKVTSDQTTTMCLRMVASEHLNSRTTALQSGTIGDMPFSRGYWTGIGKETGKVFHGAVYTASSAPDIVQVFIKDTEPYNTQEMPLLEASVQTLRKR